MLKFCFLVVNKLVSDLPIIVHNQILLGGTQLPELMHTNPQHGYHFGVWCRVKSSIEQASTLYLPSLC